MNDKIEAIRQACIKANPQIVELKFGCDFEWKGQGGDKGKFLGTTREGRFILFFSKQSESHDEELFKKHCEIIGRPIRLADVLYVNRSKKFPGAANNMTLLERPIATDIVANWNLLKDDLTLQSEETIDFIHNLLK